ncbi:MAG: DUF2075 domain-containing protein [Proteobacteria bacterium]|nr:DUF2075 domain-containing protein [Pseudomonadota bacterium]
MIVYQSDKIGFLDDVYERNIEDVVAAKYLKNTGSYVPVPVTRSWRESLTHMAKVLRDPEIPDDIGVGIEYGIPSSAKRIDFILSGLDNDKRPHLVIVELKQWSRSVLSQKDGIIIAQRGGAHDREGPHPSYQAWSYAAILEGFNEAVYEGGIDLKPCAYLHNHARDGVIDHPHYTPYIDKAPLFLHGDEERKRLREFIRQHVKHGDNGKLLYEIDKARIRPSKMLADSLVGMLKGNREFVLVDDQKLVYETCIAKSVEGSPERKQVVIIQGGPGTGKSVVAINLMVELTKKGLLAKYVSKNAAPRAVYQQKLRGQRTQAQISSMFGGSGNFHESEADVFDTLIVDEAHRLNEKSGLYGNLGENQIKEIIAAAKSTILFVDDDQIVTLNDIGQSGEIENWAKRSGAEITRLELASQFRCSGSDGYLAWLDDVLGIRPTANPDLDPDAFDFRVVDSPKELFELIVDRNRRNNKSRMVAGYCWDWKSKRNPDAFDIILPESGFAKQWNLASDSSLWITAPDSVEQVGCIHTCQGLELDYVGVIVGPDLIVRDGMLITVPEGRSKMDRSIRGWKSMLREDPEGTLQRVDRIIRNTYRTLMTRGMKGCYIHCTDAETQEYFRQRLHAR